jgi:hypothetical protein
MSQPFSRNIETVPGAPVNAPPFDGELARFERHLAAENKSPRTIRTYGDSARQLHAFLEEQGCLWLLSMCGASTSRRSSFRCLSAGRRQPPTEDRRP